MVSRVFRVALVGGMIVIGCGGGGITEADRDQARHAVGDYGRAYAAQDGETACRLLTEEMRTRYERRGESCPAAFARLASIDESELRLERASITGEQGNGLGGVVEFSEGTGLGQGGAVHLVEDDEKWLLDMDLLCLTPSCDP